MHYYNVQPRPEACSTLYTTYNIQTTGNVIGQNIESHVFALNSLGNDVDRAIVRLSQLTQYVEQLFNYIESQLAQINEQMSLMQLGSLIGGVFSALPSIAKFAASAMTIESAAIEAATGTFTNLAIEEGIELEDIVATGTAEFANLSSSGTAEFTNIVSAGTAEFTNITATGTVNFANVVMEDGAIELEDIVATGTSKFNNISSTGTAEFANITVTSGTIAGIDFEQGAIELEDIVATGTSTFNNLESTGTSTFNKITATSATIGGIDFEEGAIELEDITATGTATLQDIKVTGFTTLQDISANSIQAQSLVIDELVEANEMNVESLTVFELNFDALESRQAEDNVTDSNAKITINGIDIAGYSGEYSDNHIMSSKAVKELIDNNLQQILQGNSASNADIERRLQILEAKCKNIVIEASVTESANDGINVQSEQTLTFEERLTILERKCANIKI